MKLNIEKNTLISAEQEADERELIVPDGVKTIADEGLAHLPLIEKIVLPCSVRSIGYHAFFWRCEPAGADVSPHGFPEDRHIDN